MSLAGRRRERADHSLTVTRLRAATLLADPALPDELADALSRAIVVEVGQWKARHPAHAFLAPRTFWQQFALLADALAGEA